ncbi:hypothetical protein AURDEDRAFT_130542 [Auricularia subglabra TFB-10046 SS5]|nr:hypothetical protein AURDEDRAFT_130542 [Auricularia subglabra TFB-10046 SS5]
MSSTLRRLRTERVLADESALLQIQARLERVQREHGTTQALLAETQRAADELARETHELQDMERQTAARLAEARAALVQECISSLPDDVLRCLFDVAARDNPFTVAAVCARWRRVALELPAIWSYIAVPPPPSSMPGIKSGRRERYLAAQLRRVNILLDRSRSAPLDLSVDWSGWSCKGSAHASCKQLFYALFSQAARWRFATIGLPLELTLTTLDSLKGPTPVLEDLNIYTSSDHDESFVHPRSGYLPYAPRLQKLSLIRVGMGCAASADFPALRGFTCGPSGCSEDQFYQYLRNAADTLDTLTVVYSLTRAPAPGLSLSHLFALHLDHRSSLLASPALKLPSLTTLSLFNLKDVDSLDDLTGRTLSDTLVPFLEAVSPTVHTLYIGYTITEQCLSIVSHLRNITTLRFYPDADNFAAPALARITNDDPTVWPKLTRLANLRYDENDPGVQEALFQLISARNRIGSVGASEQDAARPSRLFGIDFEDGAPEWLVAEINRLLKL